VEISWLRKSGRTQEPLRLILFFFLSSIEERKKKRIECRGDLTDDFFPAMDFPHVVSDPTFHMCYREGTRWTGVPAPGPCLTPRERGPPSRVEHAHTHSYAPADPRAPTQQRSRWWQRQQASAAHGVSFSTDHSALYTRAEVDEFRIDASMARTKKTYAHCQVLIIEKDATINNALQDERDRFEAALEDSDSDSN